MIKIMVFIILFMNYDHFLASLSLFGLETCLNILHISYTAKTEVVLISKIEEYLVHWSRIVNMFLSIIFFFNFFI